MTKLWISGIRMLAWALLLLAVIALGAWCVSALAIAGPRDDITRLALATAVGAAWGAALLALPWRRWRRHSLGACAALFVAVLVWFLSLEPSNDRDWAIENKVPAFASIDGDVVTVHNVRNFLYRSETDFVPAYDDKRLNLGDLQGVDLVASYWMGPAIAHLFLSFAFSGGEHVAVSIETRKERGEGYSTVNGFFRQYELYYVVADERDVIGLRTNHRRDPPEQVYVYRLNGGKDRARRVFLDYMNALNALKERPEFYNSMTTNCTTTIWMHSLVNPGHVPLSWQVLASGYVPQYLHGLGRLDSAGLSFSELQQRSMVNVRAQRAGIEADFSRRIREGAP